MDNREDENLNDEELEDMDLQKQQEAQLEQQQSELEEQQKERIAAKKTQAAISSIGSKIKGGAKEAGKQVAKMVKKAILAFVKAIGIKGLIIFIIIIAAAALIYGVISGISDLLSDKANNIMSEDFISSSSTYDADVDFSNGIEITDEQVEQLIKVIENQGISLNGMFLSGDQDDSQDENSDANKKQKMKYLRQFLLAQLCTEYPDFGIQEDETHYNGIIKIRKNNSDGSDSTDMKYVKLQVFKAMINAINANSLDGGGEKYSTKEIDVNISGARNNTIPATVIIPTENLSDMPCVLMVHGFTGKRQGDNDHFISLGKILAENGIASITIDLPGCGSSTEASTNYTINNMESDMDSAINYMKNTYSINSNKIGVVGHSMGGRMASLYLNKVNAAALWAPANGDGLSGLEFLNNYQELYNTAKTNGTVESGWNFTLSKEFFEQMETSHPQNNISSFNGQNLLIAYDSADRDGTSGVLSSSTVQTVKSAAPGGTKWIEYNDDHNFLTHGEELVTETANLFCNSFLGRNANSGTVNSELLNGYTLDEIKEEIKNIYTIDGSGNLYFANWHTEEVTENSKTEKKTTVTEQAVNYLKTVEKYSMPIQTSIALCFISQNPEYVYNFIQEHVLAGEIVISVQEHESVDTFNSWFDWQITENTREYTYTEIDPDVWDWYTTGTSQNTTQYNDQNHYKKIVTDVQCVAAVTNVDTWMFKETVEYTNVPNMVEYPLGEETKVYNDATCPVTVPTNTSTISGDATSRTRTDKSYSLDYCNFTQTEKMVYNDWQKGTVNVDTAEIERKADSIIAQWKNKFRIPNSNKSEVPFVKIYDAKDMFLNMLNNNEKTQKQAEIFKFLIERTKNGDYSLDNLDMSIYKNTDLETIDVEEDIIVNVSRSQSNIVLSKEQVKKAIESCYSGQARENLLGALNDFMYIQNNNKVNAIFAVAVVTQESSAGTNWARIDSSTYNWMSCKAESGQQYYTDSTGTKWAKYTSFGNATKDLGRRISTESYYFGGGNYTVRTIGQSYCAPPDGWINSVISIMKRLFKSVGVDLDAERKQHNRPQHNGTQGDSDNSNNNNNGNNGNNGNNTNSGNNATGQVELDGSYNVNGVRLSNPIIDPISFVGSYANHGAVDINPTDNGPVPVYAAAAGTVTKAGWEGTYGNRVVIDHGSGVSTCYAHASSVVVSAGQQVEKGQLIMYQGSTGNSSGPHVHFEIRINESRIQSLAEDMFAKLGFPITRNY